MSTRELLAPRQSRRAFLTGASAALVALSATPGHALPFLRRATPAPSEKARSLFMLHQRTGEIFNEVYFDGSTFLGEPLDRFAVFARDMRTGDVGEMDPHLLDLAHVLQQRAGAEHPLILTHGFRAAPRGGASRSHHLSGEALDIAHPTLRPAELHRLAASIGRGGLGRYRTFIHIDTGPTRRW